jgi:hypothetical protein
VGRSRSGRFSGFLTEPPAKQKWRPVSASRLVASDLWIYLGNQAAHSHTSRSRPGMDQAMDTGKRGRRPGAQGSVSALRSRPLEGKSGLSDQDARCLCPKVANSRESRTLNLDQVRGIGSHRNDLPPQVGGEITTPRRVPSEERGRLRRDHPGNRSNQVAPP